MGPKKAETPPTAPAAAPTKPPKGHRQKGAGTVIVGRKPIETEDGIVLKAHERLPTVLLNEFCQREKRPKPTYDSAGRGRMTVSLPDKKNSKDDLKFCPVQSFDSDKLAKDFAALLALFHFQKSIPLERTLPEPFSSTWLSMVSAAKDEEAAAKAGARGKKTDGKQVTAPVSVPAVAAAVSAPPVDGGCSINSSDQVEKKSAEATISAVATAHAAKEKKGSNSINTSTLPSMTKLGTDWLCDQCGNLNYATLASGLPRLKCFKCQAPKSAIAVTSTISANISSANDTISKPKKAPPSAGRKSHTFF